MKNTVEQIRLGISNPGLIARKIIQHYNRIRSETNYNPDGIDVMNEDWDNLIILDGCRYDLFKDISDIPGELSKVTSRGSASIEFYQGNFQGRNFRDTVYVNTNPMLHRHSNEIDVTFHDTINLWIGDTWDEDYKTVLPEDVTQEAKRIAEKYPHKRLIVHYMQPHYPFIDSNLEFDTGHIEGENPEELTTWMQIMTGEIDIGKEKVWEAYSDNLRRALPHVEELVESLQGKTVVTSDHGNMLGERSSPIPVREWGHPPGIWTDELTQVPWLVIENGSRRNIIAEESDNESTHQDSETAKQRLESLGYIDP